MGVGAERRGAGGNAPHRRNRRHRRRRPGWDCCRPCAGIRRCPGSALKSPIQIASSGASGSASPCVQPRAGSSSTPLHGPPSSGTRRWRASRKSSCSSRSSSPICDRCSDISRTGPAGVRIMHSSAAFCVLSGIRHAAHRQEMQPRPDDRQPRQDHGAELPAAVDEAAIGVAKAARPCRRPARRPSDGRAAAATGSSGWSSQPVRSQKRSTSCRAMMSASATARAARDRS